jgi:hypothetical protein
MKLADVLLVFLDLAIVGIMLLRWWDDRRRGS